MGCGSKWPLLGHEQLRKGDLFALSVNKHQSKVLVCKKPEELSSLFWSLRLAFWGLECCSLGLALSAQPAFSLLKNTVKEACSGPVYRWVNWALEKQSYLPRVPLLVNGAGIWIHVCQTPLYSLSSKNLSCSCPPWKSHPVLTPHIPIQAQNKTRLWHATPDMDVAGMTPQFILCSSYPHQWVFPSHSDSRLGHVTCFGQWGNSKCDTETYIKYLYIGFVCPLLLIFGTLTPQGQKPRLAYHRLWWAVPDQASPDQPASQPQTVSEAI